MNNINDDVIVYEDRYLSNQNKKPSLDPDHFGAKTKSYGNAGYGCCSDHACCQDYGCCGNIIYHC